MIEALDIRVRGIVQGVGFRPFVYRLARRYIINGWVLNDLDGVFIHAEGEGKLLDEFVTELHMNPPAAAVVREVELKEVPLQDCTAFEIRESQMDDADEGTLVSADLGMCDDCARELFDPSDRRYRYPFINCTNCGPRFTIIDSLPYDRPATSMAVFEMCPDCAREYADPADRRFHAQPDACFECGPQVSWTVLCQMEGEVADGCSNLVAASPGELGLVPTSQAGERLQVGPVGASSSSPAGEAGIHQPLHSSSPRERSDAVFAAAVALLAAGGIVAVKGLGGFHLVCDAGNATAIAQLRRRKRRDGKALAVMVPDVAAARAVCEVAPSEEALLKSAARPIVLLRKRADAKLADGLADALPELGVMLPATPVQALLVHDFQEATGADMLVMTSGNVHDEPIVTDDAQACEKLAGIADAVLGNNRPILSRYDDSVVRVLRLGGADEHGNPNEAIQFIRRARGYAPVPIAVPEAGNSARAWDSANSETGPSRGQSMPPTAAGELELAPTNRASMTSRVEPVGASSSSPAAVGGIHHPPHFSIFAAGSEQKSTFTYLRDGAAFVSQHIGDMEDADVYDAWLESKARFEKLFGLSPRVLACDAHPEYLASKWAHSRAFREGLPCTEVQHHHAHIASVLGEHGLYGPAIGFAFDGTGYGADGAIWGGEVLLANQVDYERFANFAYVPMPGGAAAVKRPLRMAYGVLWAYDLLDHPGAKAALDALGDQAAVCEQMIESGLNTPHTSSVGRLFDAVSALLGVCVAPTYEGEPAILLDAVRSASAFNAVSVSGDVGEAGGRAHDASAPDDAGEAGNRAHDASAPDDAGEAGGRAHDVSISGDVGEAGNRTVGAHSVRPGPQGPCALAHHLDSDNAAFGGGRTECAPTGLPPSAEAGPGRHLEHPDPVPDSVRARYAVAIMKNSATDSSTAHDTSVVLLDAEPTVRAALDDLAAGVPVPEIARRFHDAIVGVIVQVAELARAMYDINLVALSGGCFMNRYLVEESTARLGQAGFTVALNAGLPPNDGCVSFGQAIVASASR